MEKQQRNSTGERRRKQPQPSAESNLRSAREQAVFLYFLIVFVLVSIHLDRGNVPMVLDGISLDENWTTAAGESVELSDLPPGNLDLSKDVSGMDLGRRSLCLKSIDTVFDVYADGSLIYRYRPTIPKRLGASYGMYVHTIALPESAAHLTLRLEPVFRATSASLNDVVIEDGGQYVGDLYRHNLWAFAHSSVILLVGLLFLIVCVFGKIIMNTAGC